MSLLATGFDLLRFVFATDRPAMSSSAHATQAVIITGLKIYAETPESITLGRPGLRYPPIAIERSEKPVEVPLMMLDTIIREPDSQMVSIICERWVAQQNGFDYCIYRED